MLEVRRVPEAGLSRQLTLFMIRHGESEWNSAQKHHNFYAQLKQVRATLSQRYAAHFLDMAGSIEMIVLMALSR